MWSHKSDREKKHQTNSYYRSHRNIVSIAVISACIAQIHCLALWLQENRSLNQLLLPACFYGLSGMYSLVHNIDKRSNDFRRLDLFTWLFRNGTFGWKLFSCLLCCLLSCVSWTQWSGLHFLSVYNDHVDLLLLTDVFTSSFEDLIWGTLRCRASLSAWLTKTTNLCFLLSSKLLLSSILFITSFVDKPAEF